MSTIGGSKPRRAAITASGCVPCESLTKRTPSITATVSSRCSTPANAPRPRRIASGAIAEQQPHRDRGQNVGDVVRARDRELVDGHDPAARARSRPAATGERQALDAVRDDPAVDDADAARHRSVAPVEHGTAPREPRIGGDDRVLGVEDERAVRIDAARPAGA